ncbi:hypothetical protein Pa4123_88340 [Phytohabitans aurantiacus]|uniref:Uncharacterized protein n=1 Tax=Phytohabitans aurantiacus TaxID=3016789 RepID=A0ABQ5R9W5_9ACTN|nr:hypothetical protein Pa4123_88340 [Phytohabitans aurantiacus]
MQGVERLLSDTARTRYANPGIPPAIRPLTHPEWSKVEPAQPHLSPTAPPARDTSPPGPPCALLSARADQGQTHGSPV